LSSALTLDLDDPANYAFGEAFFSEALTKLSALNVEKAFPITFPKSITYGLIPALAAGGIFHFMDYQDALGIVSQAEGKRKAERIQQNTGLKLEKALQKLELAKKEDVDEHSGEFKVKQLLQKADSLAKDLKDSKRNPDDAKEALAGLKHDIEAEREKIGQNKDFLSRLEKLTADQLNFEEGALTKEISEALKTGDAALAARQLRKLAQKMKDEIMDGKMPDEQKKAELERLKHEIEKLAGALADDEKLREGLQELSRKSMSAAEFQSLEDEIKKQAEKQNKGNKKLGDDIEKQMNDVADELERLDEENDEKLSEEEEKEDSELEKMEQDVDDAMEGLNSDDDNQEAQGQQQEGDQQQQGKGQGQSGKSGKSGKKSSASGKSVRAKGRKSGKSGMAGASGKEARQGGRQGQSGDQSDGRPNGRPGDGSENNGGPGEGHRPYRDGDAQFESQKIKGQLQAGAITGLSHFRGQGAKGDAPQEFVKAMTAAEQEAASSLELERIPMDARETVKDYFRNVKEGTGISTPSPTPSATPNK
jgi:hypothetical protein